MKLFPLHSNFASCTCLFCQLFGYHLLIIMHIFFSKFKIYLLYSFKFSSLFSTFTDFDEQQIRPLRHSRFPLLPACLNGRICFHISVLFFSCFFHFFSVIIPSGNQDQPNQLQNRRCQCCHICKCCRCQNFLRTL